MDRLPPGPLRSRGTPDECSGIEFRKKGDYRDIPLPQYVSDAIDKHIADQGTTADGYLYQGRKYTFVIRRSYQQDFTRAAANAGLPKRFVPHSLRHCFASTALTSGIPITEVPRWLGTAASRPPTASTVTSSPALSAAREPYSMTRTRRPAGPGTVDVVACATS